MYQPHLFSINGGAQFPDDMNMGGGAASGGPAHVDEGNYDFMSAFDTMSPTAMDMDGMSSNMQTSADQDTYTAPPGVSNLIARFENTNTNLGMPRKRKPTSPRESQQPPPHPPQPSSQVMMQSQQFQQTLQNRHRQISQASSGTAASPERMRQQSVSFFPGQAAATEFDVMSMMKQQQQQPGMAHKSSFSTMSSANNMMVSSPVDTAATPGDFSSMLGSAASPFSPMIASPQMGLQSPTTNDPFAALNPLRINNAFSSDQMTPFSMNFGAQNTAISPNSPFSQIDVSRTQASLNMMASPTFDPMANNATAHDQFGQDLMSFETMENTDMTGLTNDGFVSMGNSGFMGNTMRNDSISFQMGAMGMNNDAFFMPSSMSTGVESMQSPMTQQQQIQHQPPPPPTPIKTERSDSVTPGFNIWRPPPPKATKAPPLPSRPSTAVTPQFLTAQKTSGGDTVMGQGPLPIIQQQQPTLSEVPPKKPPRPKQMSISQPSMGSLSPSRSIKAETPMSPFSPESAKAKPPPPPPRPTASKPTREQVPAETWDNLKGIIRQLYLDERRPLKEVMILMEERHNFRATPKMYKTRFSQWGFAKNNTEEEVKRLLSIKFQRDAEGKTSEFVRNGRVVNLRTYLKRKGKTEYDLLDHEANADLPGHTRCRTPPPLPNLPGHMAADVKRVQELITGNMHKALLMCKEAQIDAECSWTSTMVWGAVSSDIMWEANDCIKRGNTERGTDMLNNAFRYLEEELKSMTPQVIKELLLGMINRDHAVVAPLCKFFSTWTAKHLERSHPLRPIFTALYSTQQEHGSQTLSDLIWTTMPSFVDDLEAIYGRTHPFVASALLDLLEIAEQQNTNPAEPDQTLVEYRSRVGQLIHELRPHLVELEATEGAHSPSVVALRYTLVQMMHVKDPNTAETDAAVQELHREMEAANRLFQIQYTPGGPCCYHEPIKVQPTVRRCRPRYDLLVQILDIYARLTVLMYYEEDMHTVDHVSPNHHGHGHGHMHDDFSGGGGGGGGMGYHDPQAALQAAFDMQNGFGGSYGWA